MRERAIRGTTSGANMIKGSGITAKIAITLPSNLVKQADKARGLIPRSTYIRRAVEKYLRKGKT
jgi:hypothetical protein